MKGGWRISCRLLLLAAKGAGLCGRCRADTDPFNGTCTLHPAETVLALMRNPDYCLYGFAKSKRERSAEDAETAFNQLSLQVG